jgi:hypothetical protein
VGSASAQFTTDWTDPESHPLPGVDEMRAFVDDDEHARGRAFDAEQRDALNAANLFRVF